MNTGRAWVNLPRIDPSITISLLIVAHQPTSVSTPNYPTIEICCLFPPTKTRLLTPIFWVSLWSQISSSRLQYALISTRIVAFFTKIGDFWIFLLSFGAGRTGCKGLWAKQAQFPFIIVEVGWPSNPTFLKARLSRTILDPQSKIHSESPIAPNIIRLPNFLYSYYRPTSSLHTRKDKTRGHCGRCIRVRARIDADKPLLRWTSVKIEGTLNRATFRFEKLVDMCYYCGRLDHLEKDCHFILSDGKRYNGPWLRANDQHLTT